MLHFKPDFITLVFGMVSALTHTNRVESYYMNLVKLFSVLSLVMAVTACGSSQPMTGMYGGQYNPNGTFNFNQNGITGNGQAIYGSGGQVIGYKHQMNLFNNYQLVPANQISNLSLNSDVTVNAGEKLYIDLSKALYIIYNTGGGFFYSNLHQPSAMSNGSIYVNGTQVSSGAAAPTSGPVNFRANLSQLGGSLFNPSNYQVSLYGAVYKESCTSVNGAPMQCP